MYKLEVVPHQSGSFRYSVCYCPNDNLEIEVSSGFRSSEAQAHRDGAEELKFAKLFNLGKEYSRE